jgi:formylmethanofuran dehydrogenase subunit C
MKALVFTLKTRPELAVDISALTPDNLAGKNKSQVGGIKLNYGKQKISVSKLFSISGDDSSNIHIQRSSPKLSSIGKGMSMGKIQVRGDVGDFLGKNMSGGELTVIGDTGNWAASGMSGGIIDISGNTGDYLGANFSGELHGMSDGTVIINGNAGIRVGERMRRGIIVIRGHVGEYCGHRMLAGSIIIFGKSGNYLGFGMKRGTIILTRKPGHLLATFRHCGLLKVEFLRLLFKQMSVSNKHFLFFRSFGPEAIRYAGDVSCGGQGEILILKNARLPK